MVDKENGPGSEAGESRIHRGRIRAGAIIMAIGLTITAGASVLAPGSGYVVGWGVVFLGALFFLLGLSNWLLRRRIGLFTKDKAIRAPQQLPASEAAEISKEDIRQAELELRRLGGRHNGRNFVHWIVANRETRGSPQGLRLEHNEVPLRRDGAASF